MERILVPCQRNFQIWTVIALPPPPPTHYCKSYEHYSLLDVPSIFLSRFINLMNEHSLFSFFLFFLGMVHSAIIQIWRMLWKCKYSCSIIPIWGVLYVRHVRPYITLDLIDQEVQPFSEVISCIIQFQCARHFWYWNQDFSKCGMLILHGAFFLHFSYFSHN